MKTSVAITVLCLLLAACGGGGGNPGACTGSAALCAGGAKPTSPGGTALPAAVGDARFASSRSFSQQCAAPRPAGTVNTYTGAVYNDASGSTATELQWIRSFVNETYLWFDEVPAINLAQYVVGATVAHYDPATNLRSERIVSDAASVTAEFFNSQRTPASTASGRPKDQFHFTYTTEEWSALSQAGASVGYGFEAALLVRTRPRNIVIATVTPGSPAAANQLRRGAKFLTVNGVDVIDGTDSATINEALFAPVAGRSYSFTVLDTGSSAPRSFSMMPTTVTSVPVQNVQVLPTPTGNVGYLLFNDHIATAEEPLIAAVNQFNAADAGAGIRDLVLDIRYNGGGFLNLASRLAYMVAGRTATAGKVFERIGTNRKKPFGNLADTPFIDTASAFTSSSGQPLPQLNLARVYVITSSGTCSASEAIINALRGVGIAVIQIGTATCGKPYGFFPEENCGTTYFTVQFKGVNEVGYGDYVDGFTPVTGTQPNNLPGCEVADDFSRQLGDVQEGRLAAALQYRSDGTCPQAPAAKRAGTRSGAVAEPMLVRSVLRENRWLGPR